jgi:fimbrial chaperone protein
MMMRRILLALLCISVSAFAAPVQAQGFAALVSPPRFELTTKPGKLLRAVMAVSNRSTTSAKYLIHTADWTLGPDLSVNFYDALQPGSCRPWVAIERPEVEVPGGATLRYRFEVSVPADAPAGECRFAIMIEGDKPAIAQSKGLSVPISGRIGVIVYVAIGDAAPEMEILGPKITQLNGQQVPTLRVHNSGNAHARMSGFLTGKDAKGVSYDFTPATAPILPHEEREIFLTPSTPTNEHPTLTFPVTVKGTLEWGSHQTELNELFE